MADPFADKEKVEEHRRNWKNTMYLGLLDAHEVAKRFNDTENMEVHFKLCHEDIRAMAISFTIDFKKRFGQ